MNINTKFLIRVLIVLSLGFFQVALRGAEKTEGAGIMGSLFSPGDLLEGHKDLDTKEGCLQCHQTGEGVPDSKCMDCHKEIRPFVESKSGFHGLSNKTCIECHSDHQGRKFDTTKIDGKKFQHGELTGYELEGKHAEIKCEECHKDKRGPKRVRPQDIKYLGKTKSCLNCHKKDDVHFFKGDFAKKDCGECHNLKTWKEDISFDHFEDTKFKLEGKHSDLKCNDCHMSDKKTKTMKYKWNDLKTKTCLACHEDFHKNNLEHKFQNGQCLKCHTQDSWKIKKFDHSVTAYKLVGKHADVKCVDCHKQKAIKGKIPLELKHFNFTGLKAACMTCHEDFHKFGKLKGRANHKFGDYSKCVGCHSEVGWKETPKFDHNRDTRFAVDGKHEELKCQECHLPVNKKSRFAKPPAVGIYHWDKLAEDSCVACHASPHLKEFSKELLKKKCQACHVTESWTKMKNGNGFDHEKTRFPLTGSHASTRCVDCHGPTGKQIFKFKSPEQKFCIDCHLNVHNKQFSQKFSGQVCSACHTTKNFTVRPLFDHNQTAYKLKGAHDKLKCEECHTPMAGAQPLLLAPNVKKKDFAAGKPYSMHKFLFPELKNKSCVACHADYHNGQLGSQCQKCHNETDWKKVDFDHNKDSQYPLLEKHASVKCQECHKVLPKETVKFKDEVRQVIKYKPLSTLCIDCHKDPHKGSFGNRCQDCHQEKGWKITKNFHKNFTLTGVHYVLECTECHKDGKKLGGLSQQCIACHQKDDVHSNTLPNCKDCHRQQFWEVSGFRHTMTNFPLRGAHRTLDCVECHSGGIYQGLQTSCWTCHEKDAQSAPVPPTGKIDHVTQNLTRADCTRCHRNTFSFKGGTQ